MNVKTSMLWTKEYFLTFVILRSLLVCLLLLLRRPGSLQEEVKRPLLLLAVRRWSR